MEYFAGISLPKLRQNSPALHREFKIVYTPASVIVMSNAQMCVAFFSSTSPNLYSSGMSCHIHGIETPSYPLYSYCKKKNSIKTAFSPRLTTLGKNPQPRPFPENRCWFFFPHNLYFLPFPDSWLPKSKQRNLKLLKNFVRSKVTTNKLLCITSPSLWAWILDNSLAEEEKTFGNWNVLLQKDAASIMDREL